MSEHGAEKDVRRCVECGTKTGLWVHGWDGKYRCLPDAHKGPRPDAPANHCPTCRCITPPGSTEASRG